MELASLARAAGTCLNTAATTLICLLICAAAPGHAQGVAGHGLDSHGPVEALQPAGATGVRIPSSEPSLQHGLPSTESLGADDLVEIMVSYCPELTRNFRVSTDGSLALPLLHQPLRVENLTPAQAADTLRAALLADHILADPVVSLSVLEYRSRPISIVGAVNHPITYQATNRSSLIEALAKAGGLSPTAGGTIIVTAQPSSQGNGQPAVRTIAVKELLAGAVPQANLVLHGGEEVRVPEADKIFVAGDVHRPGAYPMQTDSDTTVMKAVALSSGLDTYTSNIAFIYRKRAVGAERDEISIPLKKIMARRAPDVAMRADDILYVPTNDGKKLAGKVLGQIAGFGQTAEAGLLLK